MDNVQTLFGPHRARTPPYLMEIITFSFSRESSFSTLNYDVWVIFHPEIAALMLGKMAQKSCGMVLNLWPVGATPIEKFFFQEMLSQ